MQEEVINGDSTFAGHAYINAEEAGQRQRIRDTRPAMREPHADKGHKIQKSQCESGGKRSWPLKGHEGKKILGQVADDAHSTDCPA